MTRTELKQQIKQILSYQERDLKYGYCLSGPGRARKGWYAATVAGDQIYLGKTLQAALAKLEAR